MTARDRGKRLLMLGIAWTSPGIRARTLTGGDPPATIG